MGSALFIVPAAWAGRERSANNWWERSPNASNSTNFCIVNSDGTANNNNASNSNGVCFGFCEI